MKLLDVLDLGVAVELDATDCLAIADALNRWPWDVAGNHPHIRAMQVAFRAMAVLAAADTNMDEKTPPRQWFGKTREVWAMVDTSTQGHPKMTEEPQ